MDGLILTISASAFLLLFVLTLLVFRRVHAYDAVIWYVRLSGICAVYCLGLWWVAVFAGRVHVPIEVFTTGIVMSLILYGLLVVLFLFGVLGVFEASITLHLLTKISLAGKNGIHPNAILASYNRSTIVKRRVERFMWSGELVVVGGYYRLSKHISYFLIREYFLNVLRWIYPGP